MASGSPSSYRLASFAQEVRPEVTGPFVGGNRPGDVASLTPLLMGHSEEEARPGAPTVARALVEGDRTGTVPRYAPPLLVQDREPHAPLGVAAIAVSLGEIPRPPEERCGRGLVLLHADAVGMAEAQ